MEEFDYVYERYFKDVYHFVLSLSKDHHIAEEVTQETFFKAMNNIQSFKGNCKISSWLIQIAKNTYFSHLSKQKRCTVEDVNQGNLAMSIEDALLNKEQSFHIHTILHSLDEPYKEVFTLRVFGELPFSQIAQLFGRTDSWARVTFYRAKQKICMLMEGQDE